MKKHLVLITLAAWLTGPVAGLASTPPSDKLFGEQEQLQIVEIIKTRLTSLTGKKDPTPSDLVEQAKLSYFIGQYSTKDDDKLTAFKRGLDLLETAADQGTNPDAVLIWAANAGGTASVQRNLDALRLMEKIEQRLLKLSDKYPAHESGAAYRALASIYFNAPPFISVGSGKKAAAFASRAFAQDPNNPANMLIMARVEADNGNKQKAIELYRDVLTRAKQELYPLDYIAWHNEALVGLDEAGAVRL